MSQSLVDTELRRGRWRRFRQQIALSEPSSEGFAKGGLSNRVSEPSVRLLVLPDDPEADLISFDNDLWNWWLENRESPATQRQTQWGLRYEPTPTAAVRYDQGPGELWEDYLALHRHGGLEMELGRHATYSWDERRAFRLIHIVGRIWTALDLYQEVIERFGVSGPWEVSLALRDTQGAVLGNVAEGWENPGSGFADEVIVCIEPGLLTRREIMEWPDAEGAKSLAFALGGWIEDSWGIRQRRFLAQRGERAGEFDIRAYRD